MDGSFGRAAGEAIIGLIIAAFLGGVVFSGLAWLVGTWVFAHLSGGWK